MSSIIVCVFLHGLLISRDRLDVVILIVETRQVGRLGLDKVIIRLTLHVIL